MAAKAMKNASKKVDLRRHFNTDISFLSGGGGYASPCDITFFLYGASVAQKIMVPVFSPTPM